MTTIILPEPLEFEWDEGNQIKSLRKHGIKKAEAEQAFFNPRIIFEDHFHGNTERRHILLGVTNIAKYLCISFTVRNNKVRVISARSASKKERKKYAEEI